MTDKEQKDKIADILLEFYEEYQGNMPNRPMIPRIYASKIIDSMQEEPKECMYSKDNYTDEDRKVLCEGCNEECKFDKKEDSVNNGLDLGCGVIWRNEEPVSEDFKIALEKKVREAQDWTYIEEEGGECPLSEEFGAYDLEEFARWGANWQKEQMMAKAFDFTQEHNIACILASECLRNHGWFSRERVFNNLFRHLACVDKLFEGKFSGKTKVIVIKEE